MLKLHYCVLKADNLDVAYSNGKLHVQFQMPYSYLADWLKDHPLIQGDLHYEVTCFIQRNFDVEGVVL